MRTHAQIHAAVIAASLAAVLACDAQAAVISTVTNVSLPGLSTSTIGPVGATPAPNNDNATVASPNAIPYTVFFNALGPLDVEFMTSASGGTTEYTFTQTFVNNTGQAWTGFTFELGYGFGQAFTASGGADGLDFDLPGADPAPFASLFTSLIHLDDRMEWSGGSVPSVGGLAFTFSIDVPDGLATFHPDSVNRFTLRQTPVVATPVPEPSSMLLLGWGMLALLPWRRRAAAEGR